MTKANRAVFIDRDGTLMRDIILSKNGEATIACAYEAGLHLSLIADTVNNWNLF